MKNIGPVTGSEVVQLYVSYPDTGVTHPDLQLRGFAKVRDIAPGSSEKVTIELDKYAVSYWDVRKSAWRVTAGKYGLHAGFSSDNIVQTEEVEVKNAFVWSGL